MTQGVRGLLAFWMGGAASPPSSTLPVPCGEWAPPGRSLERSPPARLLERAPPPRTLERCPGAMHGR